MSLTDTQQALRRRAIGGSEISALVGLNPWMAPIDVWREKVGKAREVEDTPAMQRGRFLEPAIIKWYEFTTGRRVRQIGTLSVPNRPLCQATPAGISLGPDGEIVLEVKSPGHQTAHHWGDGVPDYYVPQVQWEMAATGLTHAHVAALVYGELRIYDVDFDQEMFENLYAVAEDFWRRYVVTGNPPPVDDSKSYTQWLVDSSPRPRDKALRKADDTSLLYMHELKRVREKVSDLEKKRRLIENRLRESIGDASGVTGSEGTIYYKTNKNGTRSFRFMPELKDRSWQ